MVINIIITEKIDLKKGFYDAIFFTLSTHHSLSYHKTIISGVGSPYKPEEHP